MVPCFVAEEIDGVGGCALNVVTPVLVLTITANNGAFACPIAPEKTTGVLAMNYNICDAPVYD